MKHGKKEIGGRYVNQSNVDNEQSKKIRCLTIIGKINLKKQNKKINTKGNKIKNEEFK